MSYLQNHPISPNWIREKIDEKAVKYTEEFAQYLVTSNDTNIALTTSQLRKFFGAVKKMQVKLLTNENTFDKTELIMIKPKLSYAVGRANLNKSSRDRNKRMLIEDFDEVISAAIDFVTDRNSFINFINFFESIVAYHKRYENK